jgi:hypothetical protein
LLPLATQRARAYADRSSCILHASSLGLDPGSTRKADEPALGGADVSSCERRSSPESLAPAAFPTELLAAQPIPIRAGMLQRGSWLAAGAALLIGSVLVGRVLQPPAAAPSPSQGAAPDASVPATLTGETSATQTLAPHADVDLSPVVESPLASHAEAAPGPVASRPAATAALDDETNHQRGPEADAPGRAFARNGGGAAQAAPREARSKRAPRKMGAVSERRHAAAESADERGPGRMRLVEELPRILLVDEPSQPVTGLSTDSPAALEQGFRRVEP